jgi:autophagy-related protein 11
LTDLVAPYRDFIRKCLEEADVIQRASLLALDNLQSHVRNIQNKFTDTRGWATGAIDDHENILRDWKINLKILGRVQAKNDLAFLLQRPRTPTKKKTPQKSEPTSELTLRAFINDQDVERAAAELGVASREFKGLLEDLGVAIGDVSADTRQLEAEIRPSAESLSFQDITNLYADVETLTKKIGTDYDDLLRLADSQKSVPTASRRALIHTRDLLPSLQNLAAEISGIAQQAANRRNSCLQTSTKALQTISAIQSGLGDLQSQISSLGLTSEGMEAYDVVRSVFELPIAYGSTLIESIRRSEWAEKIKANADHVSEELKTLKDEEHRRRKKWMKNMGGLINNVPEEVGLGIEMSVTKSDDAWPSSSRQEVFEYIEALRNLQVDDAVQHITHLLKELESSKPRRKSARAFKNGSVYDADLTLERSSLLLEDEEEAKRTLQNEKSRLEDKLRASDSRVRKLEDLLHRQSQMNRPTSANFGPSPSELDRPPLSPSGLPSPRPSELILRRSSVSSRRLSSNQNPDEKILVQRIVALEADLRAEHETVLKLQRDAHADRRASTESRDRMNEAESTKKDLLANLDAQRQEFDDERQLLEDEMHRLKIRLEEVEDELDRVLGSRDHQKMTSDNTIVDLQAELERLQRKASDEVAKAQGQADFVRNDFIFQRSRADSSEKQLQQVKEEFSSLQSQNLSLADQLRTQTDARLEHIYSLQAAHSHLSPAGAAPDDMERLVRAIEILSEGISIHARNADEAAQLASAENKSLEEQVAQTKGELEQVQNKLIIEERETFTIREALAQERGKLVSLRNELADAQAELKNLRAKFAAGETGSEALKERVSEEERKVADLTEKLAVADSNTQTLEQETSIWKDKVQSLTVEAKQWKDRLDVRGVRAKDLSQRLLSHNDRMIRMLEQMGYSVTRQDNQLVIQRASKVTASTILTSEVSTSMNRSLSGQSPTQHYSNASDLDTLYWMSDSDATSEDSKFQTFISTLSRLDIESACEMIAKRYKDVETLARKYQKDSRAYREKAHRLQSEAHDKIAYRSFKEGDLALFLPTRNQATRPWAAFNVGAPHYFLREQDTHKLQARDWLLARISKVEERVVDLSKSLTNGHQAHNHPSGTDRHSVNVEVSDQGSMRSMEDENPFELSDGLRWYMIDAAEEKPGTVPVLTPGLGKSTVAATNIDAKGSIRLTKEGKKSRDTSGSGGAAMATKRLSKSLDSRRSSSTSKKGHGVSPTLTSNLPAANESAIAESSSRPPSSSANAQLPPSDRVVKLAESDATPDEEAREDAPIFEAVRKDLLFGP